MSSYKIPKNTCNEYEENHPRKKYDDFKDYNSAKIELLELKVKELNEENKAMIKRQMSARIYELEQEARDKHKILKSFEALSSEAGEARSIFDRIIACDGRRCNGSGGDDQKIVANSKNSSHLFLTSACVRLARAYSVEVVLAPSSNLRKTSSPNVLDFPQPIAMNCCAISNESWWR